MNLKSIGSLLKKMFNWKLLKETYQEWSNDKASRLAAALAYYSATAMAPLIIGVLAIAGFLFSREQAQTQVVAQVRTYVGTQGAEIVETILANADQPDLARMAGLFSLVALLWSASNIFVQLQDSLDTIWGVQLRPDLPLLRKVQHRLFPLLTILGIGLLLLVLLVASTALSAAGTFVSDLIPGGALLWQIINFLISLAVIALLFGIVFKILPDVKIAWQDVWPGAALTALLFVVGQFVLGWYLGRQSGASVYGAAGSLIILLLWLYYSAQIFLFGAEFTQVYATRYGAGVLPDKDAVTRDAGAPVKPVARALNAGKGDQHANFEYGKHDYYALQARQVTPSTLGKPSLFGLVELVGEVVNDGRRLFGKEIQLVRAEIRETLMQLTRSVALLAGGGLLLYGGALFVLIAVPLLFWAILSIPLWLAIFLVGILLLVEGWILTRWARGRLKRLVTLPKQSTESLRQDVEMVKGQLTN